MIPAAVEKCEEQRKPEAFFGYRKAEERQTEDLRVPGSIPGGSTNMGECLSLVKRGGL